MVALPKPALRATVCNTSAWLQVISSCISSIATLPVGVEEKKALVVVSGELD